MLKRIKKKTKNDKINKCEYFFNRQILLRYFVTASNIKPDASGMITIDAYEYEKLKDIEHQWMNDIGKQLLSDELMQHDLELMKALLNQGD